MEKFKLIGVTTFNGNEYTGTKYYQIGEMNDAVEYAKLMSKYGYNYKFTCCDVFGVYICDL